MNTQFEVAAGSIMGRDHARPLVWSNNQDGLHWQATANEIIAVVTDGCGSSPHSEVGAKLGAPLIVERLALTLAEMRQSTPSDLVLTEQSPYWAFVQADVLSRLRLTASVMGGNFQRTVEDYLLFAAVGVVVTPLQTAIFSVGDGVYCVNSKVHQLGPFPGNAPPYLAYNLIAGAINNPSLLVQCRFQIQVHLPTDEVDSILIGTDGCVHLIQAADKRLPGRDEKLGPIAQFWVEDRFFQNPDQVRRRLAVASNESIRLDQERAETVREPGLLPDDTTLITIRRRKA